MMFQILQLKSGLPETIIKPIFSRFVWLLKLNSKANKSLKEEIHRLSLPTTVHLPNEFAPPYATNLHLLKVIVLPVFTTPNMS